MKKITHSGVEITFDDLEFERLDDCFECRGEDKQGNIYSGLITKSCGEYGGITEIELIKKWQDRPMFNFDIDPPIISDPYQSNL